MDWILWSFGGRVDALTLANPLAISSPDYSLTPRSQSLCEVRLAPLDCVLLYQFL